MSESLLKAEHLFKSYSGKLILNDISLDIKGGKILGLLGPNGAGKTTLIRTITGILKADEGHIFVEGAPLGPQQRFNIGYLPEERGLYKKMKTREQLVYLGRLKGLSKAEAIQNTTDWLKKFEIENWANKTIEELSKGMAQKVQFISTVIHKPSILILDEPFSGFDPVNTELIKNEILALKEEGMAIMLSTHDMNNVQELCDDILMINKGNTVLSGTMKEISSTNSGDTYTVLFKGNMINFTTALWTGFELVKHEKLENNLMKVQIRSIGGSNINSLLGAILPTCEVISVNKDTVSMHDIFMKQLMPENESTDADGISKENQTEEDTAEITKDEQGTNNIEE